MENMREALFTNISLIWMATAGATFIFLLFVTAPYGRYTTKGWGKLIDNRLGWVLMELPSFAIILYFLIRGIRNPFAIFLAGLWLAHYLYRTFIFPLRLHTKGKKMPISIVFSAIGFNGVNAGLNGYFLMTFASYPIERFTSPIMIIGCALFLFGTVTHILSDRILINLRAPGETGYKIPHGYLFKFVSCPNFLGEMLVWTGFALLAWNVAALSFLVWTIANVLPRGLKHHGWYKSHFEEYPTERKAVFPFIL